MLKYKERSEVSRWSAGYFNCKDNDIHQGRTDIQICLPACILAYWPTLYTLHYITTTYISSQVYVYVYVQDRQVWGMGLNFYSGFSFRFGQHTTVLTATTLQPQILLRPDGPWLFAVDLPNRNDLPAIRRTYLLFIFYFKYIMYCIRIFLL